MKAWILEKQAQVESKPLTLVEVNAPHPQENEVRLKVLCCGVCRTDIHIIEGDLPLKKSPVILGHETILLGSAKLIAVGGMGAGSRVTMILFFIGNPFCFNLCHFVNNLSL